MAQIQIVFQLHLAMLGQGQPRAAAAYRAREHGGHPQRCAEREIAVRGGAERSAIGASCSSEEMWPVPPLLTA